MPWLRAADSECARHGDSGAQMSHEAACRGHGDKLSSNIGSDAIPAKPVVPSCQKIAFDANHSAHPIFGALGPEM